MAAAAAVKVRHFDDFLLLGQLNKSAPVDSKASDACTIMYTSGSTGTPKVKHLVFQSLPFCVLPVPCVACLSWILNTISRY